MSNNNDNTQVLEPIAEETVTAEPVVEAATEVAPAVTKTKKELKKERKEIKKRKKEARREAFMHSAKSIKVQQTLITILTVVVIISMLVCSISAIFATKNLLNGAAASSDSAVSGNDSSDQQSTNNNTQSGNQQSTNNNTQSGSDNSSDAGTNAPAGDSNASTDAPAGDDNASTDAPAGDNNASTNAPVAGDLSTKEGVVEYYKAAHAKVFAEAKSVTRTYDNPTNYNGVVEVGDNSTIAGIAQTLMNTFMKPNTEPTVFEGTSEIKSHFPPANENGCSGLTADMISDYKCEEKDGNYIITLTLNSTEENPDDGTMAQHMVEVVGIDVITESAGSMVTIKDFKNLYVGSTVIATIEKDTGRMIALDVNNPSYMCFGEAKALIITVKNCKLGLHYEQKWTVQW